MPEATLSAEGEDKLCHRHIRLATGHADVSDRVLPEVHDDQGPTTGARGAPGFGGADDGIRGGSGAGDRDSVRSEDSRVDRPRRRRVRVSAAGSGGRPGELGDGIMPLSCLRWAEHHHMLAAGSPLYSKFRVSEGTTAGSPQKHRGVNLPPPPDAVAPDE